MKAQGQINVKNFESRKGFIHDYQKLIKDVVIPYQYAVLHDQVEGVEKSHVAANFENAARVVRGEEPEEEFYGMVFQDSDAAKWIEAAAYSLAVFPDADLEKKADELIDKIAAAQDVDGYLNTRFTIGDREKRWTNLLEGHELYCAGHMMEAAVAYYETTGKDKLLKVMQKNAAHIYRKFVVEGKEGYPGHPEVELALLRMYQATGDKKCLELAGHFINVRGVDRDFYKKEVQSRDWKVWGNDASDYDYQQSGKPVREQSDATGHSVRAVYLYTGMAALAAETDDKELLAACKRLFGSITEKRMYVTGGIGSTAQGEAFTVDWNLPNDTAYAETCASIGLMFFASRMLEAEADSVYGDVMERAFYNTVLAGMQLDGKRFFYVNPLEVIPGVSEAAVTHRHVLLQRPGWYACACCPPNVARCIASIGKYAYGENETTAFIHMFMEGKVSFANGLTLEGETKYPYEFQASYRVLEGEGALAVREPDWSRGNFRILVNGRKQMENKQKGYYYLEGIRKGDLIEVFFDDQVKKIYASTRVAADSGCAALQRGPLVYCVESIDNDGDVLSLSYAENGQITVQEFEPDLLKGTIRIKAQGYRMARTESLYTYEKQERTPCTITAVPYYTWGNRGMGQMRVWLPESN